MMRKNMRRNGSKNRKRMTRPEDRRRPDVEMMEESEAEDSSKESEDPEEETSEEPEEDKFEEERDASSDEDEDEDGEESSDEDLEEKSSNSERKNSPKRGNPFRRGNVIYAGGSKEAERHNLMLEEERRKRMLFGTVLAALLILAAVAVYVSISLRQFKGYKVLHSVDINFENHASYEEFGGNLLKYTSDGVSYINSNGDIVWTAGIDMKVPIADVCGDYAVVADKGGNSLSIFNLEGQVGSQTMQYSILDVSIAAQGAVTVVLESDTTNYVNMYSKAGDMIYEIQTSIDKSGYPLDIAISENGQKLITSYFLLDGVEAKNALTTYNFGEVGQNENADRMVGGFTFTDELFAKVQFVTNDVIAAFSDKEIVIYAMREKPTERKRISYDGDIQSVFYSHSYIGVIERSKDAEAGSDLVMRVFDLSGDEKFSYPFTMVYDNIYASEEDIIVTGTNQCLIVTKNGRTKFRYAFDSMIRSMIPSSGKNEYIVTLEGRTETIRLKSSND